MSLTFPGGGCVATSLCLLLGTFQAQGLSLAALPPCVVGLLSPANLRVSPNIFTSTSPPSVTYAATSNDVKLSTFEALTIAPDPATHTGRGL